jgi:uncharacterized protein (TIGR02145 family)
MEKAKTNFAITSVFILLFSYGNISGNTDQTGRSDTEQTGSKSIQTKPKAVQTDTKSVQAKPKPAQTGSKSVQTKPKSAQPGLKSAQTKSKPVQKSSKPDNKKKDDGTVRIGEQSWATANLNVSTFRNGDTIPEARTNKEWTTAGESGKPAWCYYNNDPAMGLKYGKLYNWYAVNDPRGLAPAGWTLSSDDDWTELAYFSGGQQAAGKKLKNTGGWSEGNNGTNETGFTGLPGGYRVENGSFLNLGSIGTWWSSTESKAQNAIDHYIAMSGSLSRSSSPRQRGESVRCLRK